MCSSPDKNFILTEIVVAVEVVIEELENWFLSKMSKKKQVKWLYREMQTASHTCASQEYQVRMKVLNSCSWIQDLWLLMENDLAFVMVQNCIAETHLGEMEGFVLVWLI